MNLRSYSKGTILWVDDDFAKSDARGEGSEIDIGRRTFGDTDSRVYRLLGLHLILATCYDEAVEALDDLTGPDNRDTFTIAVVDLRIPKSRWGDPSMGAPDVKYGRMFASRLLERGVPFYFLSAQSSAVDILREYGLESVPYYRKQVEQGRAMMPEELSRRILNEFRNRISWIDIENYYLNFDADSILPFDVVDFSSGHKQLNVVSEKALAQFPFFGSFRDFVERWEHRPFQGRRQTVVLRCPEGHSDQFVFQCLVVIFSSSLLRDGKVRLKYINPESSAALRLAEPSRLGINELVVYRLHPSYVSADEVGSILRNRREGNVVFVLPNDDSADAFLEVLPRQQDTVYDDLPMIRLGDTLAREELIRRTCEFVFQQWRIELDGGQQSLAQFYLDHPEVAINPINWVALTEKNDIAEDLSDPYEIMEVFYQATSELGTPAFRQKLVSGIPLDFGELLKVADERIARLERNLPGWRKRALGLWLSTSWHSPYGVTDGAARTPERTDDSDDSWEDHCLQVAVELSKAIDSSALNGRDPAEIDLLRVKTFLENQVVSDLLNGVLKTADDSGLEFLRWPHVRFPMPAALSRRLREARRYLSIQSDYLDLAPLLPAGNMSWDVLQSTVDEYAARLEWMKSVATTLPEGWRQSVRYLAWAIESRELPRIWAAERGEVWDALLGLLRNALPVSVIYHYLVTGKIRTEAEQDKFDDRLRETNGYGTLLGMLRGHRREMLKAHALRLHNLNGKAWRFAAEAVSAQVEFADRLGNEMGPSAADRVGEVFGATRNILGSIHRRDIQTDLVPDQVQDDRDGYLRQYLDVLNEHASSLDDNWFIEIDKRKPVARPLFEGNPKYPATAFPSLFATPEDYIWQGLDLLHQFRLATYPIRHFDGYHVLAVLNDLRVGAKDSPPQVGTGVMEEVLQLLVWGLEGLVAQLKFCLEEAGCERASAIRLETVEAVKPFGYQPIGSLGMGRFFKIKDLESSEDDKSSYGVFIHGIPGMNVSNNYNLHRDHAIIPFNDAPAQTAPVRRR